jgi:hypothetical protein
MTPMLAEMRDVLREAGASDEKARKAGEAVADYRDAIELKSRLHSHGYILTFNTALLVTITGKLFLT